MTCLNHKVKTGFGIIFNVYGFGSGGVYEVKANHFFAGKFDGAAALPTSSLVVD